MVALVTRGEDDKSLAIHRTFLARDGAGKAPVNPQKMMLGPCRGGAVRLAAPGEVLMVGEGIETCFAAMQATGTTRLGGTVDLRARGSRIADRRARRDRTRRWRRPGEAARANAHGAGSARVAAYALPARRKGWISTIC